jgi:uncharacterized protein
MDVIDAIIREAKRLLSTTSGSHGWDHVERVYRLCIRIGEVEGADLEILKMAAILHDIGRDDEISSGGKICHAERGAALGQEILEKLSVPREKIDKVVHCIETHRFRGNRVPQSLEARVLFDADKLDSIGAVGVGRAFLFAGEVGARLYNKGMEIEKTDAYSKEDTAFREFSLKLQNVKDRMLTREGKRLAEDRDGFMVSFFQRLHDEVDAIK